MPNEEKLRQHKHLGWLGKHLHDPNLWHLTRKSVSRAVMVGLFSAFIPIPLQMIFSAVIAVVLRCNLAISVGLVWITNPLTMPPIFYCTYLVGDFLIGKPGETVEFEMSMEWLASSISHIWWPLLFGSLVCGIFFSALGYFAVNWFWAWHVGNSWKKRKKNKPLS